MRLLLCIHQRDSGNLFYQMVQWRHQHIGTTCRASNNVNIWCGLKELVSPLWLSLRMFVEGSEFLIRIGSSTVRNQISWQRLAAQVLAPRLCPIFTGSTTILVASTVHERMACVMQLIMVWFPLGVALCHLFWRYCLMLSCGHMFRAIW